VVCGGAPGERIWPRTLCPDSIIYPFEPFPAGTRLMIKGELDSPPIPPDHPLLSELRQKRSTKPRSERGFTFLAELGRHAMPHGLTHAVGIASSGLRRREPAGTR
jgi:hypothetical protein